MRKLLLITIILIFGCDNKDKWKAVPLKINKQESYNYSELISGELDSSKKDDLEEVRKNISKNNKDLSKQLQEHRTKTKSNFISTIRIKIINIYNWILDLL